MQKKSDPRHKKRIAIVKNLFAAQFQKNQTIPSNVKDVIAALPKIDKLITQYAPEWPIEQIPALDLAVLRLAVFELLYQKGTPYKVVVDEAVEIAKEFGSDTSYEFVNGVLGSVIEKELGVRKDG